MSSLLPSAALRGLASASSSSSRSFSTSIVTYKKSNRARGAARKSPRNQVLFTELSPRLRPKQGGIPAAASGKSGKKASNNLEPAEGETLLTLEQACEQLQSHGAAKRPLNAFEVHIVTSVSSHQTNALRGRIAYPRDPRTKQERLLIFAEEGSEAAEAVKEVVQNEAASSSSSSGEPGIIVGGSELISQVLNNRVTGFTKVLCTNTLLGEVSKGLARSLGPKGLMPNARRGTVVPSDDSKSILNAIRESKGAMDWRSDKVGVIRGAVGRLNFDKQDVKKNVTTLLDAIVQKVPTLGSQQSSQGAVQAKEYAVRDKRSPGELKKAANIIKQVHLSSTQGPGFKLDLRDVLA
ncbi:Ribosomal protein L1/ribosomal biogenesis protein [Kalmanozyma brasiliensis GHG001]|uniref:50S ribosomal protein L1 n=1 Tax=Kalmanozyma brasiliensis (strain GHG001) TaxID=1365824 RepID=V5GLA6_KALBG|nr:Ribosomal protein L1/ribosomal biogenesis protein [Kalmanozyma brasiliensis GHG001]EST06737.1 Ribosomal protein L1/ribosomal biogenesis protein [Kalmanozyma brasiliensis GHG001]